MGNRELWRNINWGAGNFKISSKGRVKSISRIVENGIRPRLKKERFLKIGYNTDGYPQVQLNFEGKYKMQRVHRLIAAAFIPNPENKPYVNHKNGIKTDNRIENLEWCTGSENQLHAFRTGLRKQKTGESHHNARLKDTDIPKIRKLLKSFTQRKVAKMFNVSQTTIKNINLNKTYIK